MLFVTGSGFLNVQSAMLHTALQQCITSNFTTYSTIILPPLNVLQLSVLKPEADRGQIDGPTKETPMFNSSSLLVQGNNCGHCT